MGGDAMPDEIVMTIAAALAASGADALVGGGQSAILALVRLLRHRFARRPEAIAALEAAEENPEDESAVTALAETIESEARLDPDFAEQLRQLWAEASAGSTAITGGVVNNLSGRAERAVQARDIRGDVNF
jgi:hypothetical protein